MVTILIQLYLVPLQMSLEGVIKMTKIANVLPTDPR